MNVKAGRRYRKVIATARVGVNPQDVTVNAQVGAAYVPGFVNGTVSVISGTFTVSQSGSVSVIAPCRA